MPKINVGRDERYPDYCIVKRTTDKFYPELEVTDKELRLIRRADRAYDKAQAILGRAFKK